MAWAAVEDGGTIGQPGTEGGQIVSDEEYEDGARITLERGGPIAPFAITCGVYGWAFHTHFVGEAEARGDYDAMKVALADIVARIPQESDPDLKLKSKSIFRAIEDLVAKFP